MGEEVFADMVVRVTLDDDGLLTLRRLPGEYEIQRDLARMVQGVTATVERHADEATALLIDTRRGIGSQDPDFETIMAEFHRFLDRTFGRVAWVIETQVGQLQAQRYASALGVRLRAFRDEAEARRWLSTG